MKNKKVFILMFLSALTALILEVTSTKTLMYYYTQTTYSVSLMLALFLTGLMAGSYIISIKNPVKQKAKQYFMLLQSFACFYSLLVLTQFKTIPLLINLNDFVLKTIVSSVFILPVAFVFGASFPLLNNLIDDKKTQTTNKLYTVDLLGAITGAMFSGFVLIPFLGLGFTIILSSLLCLTLVLLTNINKKTIGLTIAFSVIFLFFTGSTIAPVNKTQKKVKQLNVKKANEIKKLKGKKLFEKTNEFGKTKIIQNKQGKYLIQNNRIQCQTNNKLSEEKISEITLKQLNKQETKNANIGLGCGFSLNKLVTSNKTKQVDVIEINPLMKKASDYFSKQNNNALNNKKTNLVIENAYNYFLTKNKKYNAIVMDIESPEVLHSSSLYTTEFFEEIKKDLTKKGVFSIWAFNGNKEYKTSLFHSLKQSFNYVKFKEINNFLLFFASNKELNLELTSKEKQANKEIKNTEGYELNTLNNLVLEKYFVKSIQKKEGV